MDARSFGKKKEEKANDATFSVAVVGGVRKVGDDGSSTPCCTLGLGDAIRVHGACNPWTRSVELA